MARGYARRSHRDSSSSFGTLRQDFLLLLERDLRWFFNVRRFSALDSGGAWSGVASGGAAAPAARAATPGWGGGVPSPPLLRRWK